MKELITKEMNEWFMQTLPEEVKDDVLTELTKLAVKLTKYNPEHAINEVIHDIVYTWEALGMPIVVQQERIAVVILQKWRDNSWD